MKKVFVITALAVSLGISGCATKVIMSSSTDVPAATGLTELSKDANGNTKVQLSVQHLAHPTSLTPPRSVYVVWVETNENQYINVGQLQVDKNLEGKLVTITPYKYFRLIITAEDSPSVSKPSEQTVITTELLNAK